MLLYAVVGGWCRSSSPDIGSFRPAVIVPPLDWVGAGLLVTGATGLVLGRLPGTLRPAWTAVPLCVWVAWWLVIARPALTAAPATIGATPVTVARPAATTAVVAIRRLPRRLRGWGRSAERWLTGPELEPDPEE